jgi:hypothetical protein
MDWRCTALYSVIARGRQAFVYEKSETESKTRICLSDDKAGDNEASRPSALFEQHTGKLVDWLVATSKIFLSCILVNPFLISTCFSNRTTRI